MTLTFQEAAQILKISPATVKNWLKAGVLQSTKLLHVKETKKKISSGKLNRLQKGANKHQSKKIHVHAELLSNKSNVALLNPLIEKYGRQKKELLLAVYLRQLSGAGLIKFSKNRFVIGQKLEKEISAWNIQFRKSDFLSVYQDVQYSGVDFTDSLLSYLHQSVNETSAKQDLGAYYTPASAVKKTLQKASAAGTICDPCCGSGNFLVEAYSHMRRENWPSPETSVFGFDCDPLAVLIARANLTLVSLNRIDVLKAVRQTDFLLNRPIVEFDYIMTNPPWGAYPQKNTTLILKNKFCLKNTKESFSFFILASLQTIKRNAHAHFILPQSFMNVAAHAEIRRHLLSNFTVHEIEILSEKFSGVMTGSILVSIQNSRPLGTHAVLIKSAESCSLLNSAILSTQDCILPLHNDNQSLQVIREIEAASDGTLKGQGTWGLGLVTGNNEKYLFESKGKNRLPVITGAQVFRYQQPKATFYCHSDISKFQQAAPSQVYRAKKKLIYRFIAKELVFAIDSEGTFTLNSANILIPDSEKYSCEFLCGLFNSKVGQYYFSKKFSSIKVLRSHLENFPLPKYDKKIFLQIEKCVAELQSKFNRDTVNKLDKLFVAAYGLTTASAAVVLEYKMNVGFNP